MKATRFDDMVERAIRERKERTRILFPRTRKRSKHGGDSSGGTDWCGIEHLQEEAGGESVRRKAKWRDEYELAQGAANDASERDGGAEAAGGSSSASGAKDAERKTQGALTLALHSASADRAERAASSAVAVTSSANPGGKEFSASIIRRQASRWPKPDWHAPWKLYRVVSGHMGWVRSIAFDPSNSWFVTGSADRTIKVWDLASGRLKLTLTGHTEQVTGLAVSDRHPYMFSCGLDKKVKCWDLEYNRVIRNYHGHLSGVYSLKMHPTLDILFTGGRDSCCRVWDMRTKAQIHVLSGHENTVCSILAQGTDPQVITGSYDSQIKLWDLVAAKPMATLTHHKKGIRAMGVHPKENTFCAASSDNIKKFALPLGKFMHNTIQHQKSIVNTLACNDDGVMVTGSDNGHMWFWDWKSGNKFQEIEAQVQPGSLDSEAGIFASSFDVTGTRLLTCEADKTIKFYKEDLEATPETHPVRFKPPKDFKRF